MEFMANDVHENYSKEILLETPPEPPTISQVLRETFAQPGSKTTQKEDGAQTAATTDGDTNKLDKILNMLSEHQGMLIKLDVSQRDMKERLRHRHNGKRKGKELIEVDSGDNILSSDEEFHSLLKNVPSTETPIAQNSTDMKDLTSPIDGQVFGGLFRTPRTRRQVRQRTTSKKAKINFPSVKPLSFPKIDRIVFRASPDMDLNTSDTTMGDVTATRRDLRNQKIRRYEDK